MRMILGLLILLATGSSDLVLSHEGPRTQEQLAMLPMHERLPGGIDAREVAELEKCHEKAVELEGWKGMKRHAEALLEYRTAKQGKDHYEVTDARELLQKVKINARLNPDHRQQLEVTELQNEQLVQFYQQGRYRQGAELAEKVLETRKLLLKQEHTELATSLNNLAACFRLMEESSKAESLQLKALDLRKLLLGEKDYLL